MDRKYLLHLLRNSVRTVIDEDTIYDGGLTMMQWLNALREFLNKEVT